MMLTTDAHKNFAYEPGASSTSLLAAQSIYTIGKQQVNVGLQGDQFAKGSRMINTDKFSITGIWSAAPIR